MHMRFEGGVLDGGERDIPLIGTTVKCPLADGRRLIGWDDGPIYSYPHEVYEVDYHADGTGTARYSHTVPA